MLLSVDDIRLDGGTQTRQGIDYTVVGDYADAMKVGAKFPAVEAVHDGEAYWLWDGFHRVNAAMSAGLDKIEANIRQGTREDAVWLSAGANAFHGLRRTNLDKRRAVMAVLAIPRFRERPTREIADHCGVSHELVADVRRSLSDSDKTATSQTEKGNSTQRKPNVGAKQREKEEQERRREQTRAATEARQAKREEKKQREERPAPRVEFRSEAYAVALRGLTTSLHSHTIEALLSLGPVERNALWDDLRRHHESKKQAA